MNRILEAFNKGYCSINFVDSIIITVTVLVVFFVCHFIWFLITETKGRPSNKLKDKPL